MLYIRPKHISIFIVMALAMMEVSLGQEVQQNNTGLQSFLETLRQSAQQQSQPQNPLENVAQESQQSAVEQNETQADTNLGQGNQSLTEAIKNFKESQKINESIPEAQLPEEPDSSSENNAQNMFLKAMKSNLESVFRTYISDPIPEGVDILDGKSASIDLDVFLVFKADSYVVQEITKDYEVVPFEVLKLKAKEWFKEDITQIPNILSYQKNLQLETHYKTLYLFWDLNNNKVFFKVIVPSK